jgi:hypothetical protein
LDDLLLLADHCPRDVGDDRLDDRAHALVDAGLGAQAALLTVL